ncbi:MAG TPA: imidazole glycerol phosphate synthase cyclase subunit [Longimicrobiales bacterium]|nr:imidazole glycerol phosphate synthase cyclase subunit [Longimicrobiales bacterium]
MLKRRIIPLQLLLDGRLVKSVQFDSFRDVGNPVSSARVYNAQYADELILLGISRTERVVAPLTHVLERVSEVCFMPLTVGGGIDSVADAALLIRSGADKVLVNSAAYRRPALIAELARELGSQAVVVGIDAQLDPATDTYALRSDCGRTAEPVRLEEHVARSIDAGAGEIMVTSIDRDGTMRGLDLDLVSRVTALSSAPVIAAGGVGHYDHLKDAFLQTNVAAVACGSLFNFTDSNPMRARAYLTNYGVPCKVV